MSNLRENTALLIGMPIGASIILLFASFRLSGEALSVLIGATVGVVASIPASLLILSALDDQEDRRGRSVSSRRPVVMVVSLRRERQNLSSATPADDGRVQITHIKTGRN